MATRSLAMNNKGENSKENRRRHLIDATLRAIAKVGYASATLLHVAQEAGLSPSIVNFYFKSKEQLLLATLEQITLEYSTYWQAAVAKGKIAPASGLDAIIDLDFQSSICNSEKISIWLAFWAEAANNRHYHDVVSKLEGNYTAETEMLCQRLIQEGGYEGIDPKAAALGLNALIDGLWVDCLIDPSSFNREEAKRICRLYLSGLFPQHFTRPLQANEDIPGIPLTGKEPDKNDRGEHLIRLAGALRKRLHPIGPIDKTSLANQLGIGLKVLDSWLEGRAEPSSWQIGRLIACTDAQLWAEIYQPLQEKLQARLNDQAKELSEKILKEVDALSRLTNS